MQLEVTIHAGDSYDLLENICCITVLMQKFLDGKAFMR